MAPMPQILVSDPFSDNLLEDLHHLPVKVDYIPLPRRASILENLWQYQVWVMNSAIQVDREAIDHASSLQLIIRAGVGLDHIDVAYCQQKGIAVSPTPGGNASAVGEQAVGMLLNLLHHISRADQQVRQFSWLREPNRGHELGHKTVGIIGYGYTGRAFARCLTGFGCRILAYDKYISEFGSEKVEEADLEQLFSACDVLSLHVPLTPETHHLVDDTFLRRFERPLVLLNLSRGKVVSLRALLGALNTGQVQAAGLDVLENEHFDRLTPGERQAYQDLFSRDNVLITPHIGGWTWESKANIEGMILEIVKRHLAQAPRY